MENLAVSFTLAFGVLFASLVLMGAKPKLGGATGVIAASAGLAVAPESLRLQVLSVLVICGLLAFAITRAR